MECPYFPLMSPSFTSPDVRPRVPNMSVLTVSLGYLRIRMMNMRIWLESNFDGIQGGKSNQPQESSNTQ